MPTTTAAPTAVEPLVVPATPVRPLSSVEGVRVCVAVEDVVAAATLLARCAGLSLVATSESSALLSDPATQAVVLRFVRRGSGPADVADGWVMRRLTFRVPGRHGLVAAASAAARAGVQPVRALDGSRFACVHFAGPEGIEIGFAHRAIDLRAERPPVACHPSRFTNGKTRDGLPILLDHVHVDVSPSEAAALEQCPGGWWLDRGAKKLAALRTASGATALVARRSRRRWDRCSSRSAEGPR